MFGRGLGLVMLSSMYRRPSAVTLLYLSFKYSA